MGMQDVEALDAQLRDKVWSAAQRLIVALVIFMFGVLLGFVKPQLVAPIFRPIGIVGPAAELRRNVERLTEREQILSKERETLKKRMAIMDRDKKDLERQIDEMKARLATLSSQLQAR